MRHLLLASAVLLLASCNPVQKKEKSSTSAAINRGAPYLWTDLSSPLTLQISDEFDNDEIDNITEMSTAWKSAVDDKKTFFDYDDEVSEKCDTVSNLDQFHDDILGVYKCSTTWDPSLPSSALAVTQIYGQRNNIGTTNEYVEILHADILVNYRYHSFDTGNSGPNYDLRTVILHEMGHFLGLTHKAESTNRNASVMYPSISSSEAKREPTSIDISDIASKYDIDMGGSGGATMSTDKPVYKPDGQSPREPVKILIELHADRTCVHKINGVIVKTH